MFLEISQNIQENTCAKVSFLIKLQASGLQIILFWFLILAFVSLSVYKVRAVTALKASIKDTHREKAP